MILQMVILHDAIKTIKNEVFVLLFLKKKAKPGFKKTGGLGFSKNPGFSQPWLSFNTLFMIFSWSDNLEQVTSLSV